MHRNLKLENIYFQKKKYSTYLFYLFFESALINPFLSEILALPLNLTFQSFYLIDAGH